MGPGTGETKTTDYEKAQAAKKIAVEQLMHEHPEVNGVGLTSKKVGVGRRQTWILKVNLLRPVEKALPEEIAGIPVVSEVVGEVSAS